MCQYVKIESGGIESLNNILVIYLLKVGSEFLSAKILTRRLRGGTRDFNPRCLRPNTNAVVIVHAGSLVRIY